MAFTSLAADDCNSISDSQKTGIEVTVKTLDELLSGLDEIRLLKIDIEGYELKAFMGAVKVLVKAQFVYFELWDKLTLKYGHSPNDVIRFLEGMGFKIYRVNELQECEFIALGETFSNIENLLAVSNKVEGFQPILNR